ncbi:MAG TPA: VWA domain-containing protein, partial [Blastocatellia bacterium]|nr:VWA domain-containing protein [Blastocatellia bacterium]
MHHRPLRPIAKAWAVRFLILIGTPLLVSHNVRSQENRLQRDFSDRVALVSVENTVGATEVRTWDQALIRVVATRKEGPVIDSEVLCERAPGRLGVSVRSKEAAPVTLILFVPASINISIRSTSGAVAVAGAVAGLSIDTQSGSVTIELPDSANVDVALRAIEGFIETAAPIKVFGQRDEHTLDGRLGGGGATTIVRTTKGNINLRAGSQQAIVTIDRKVDRSAQQIASSAGFKSGAPPKEFAESAHLRSSDEAIKLEARLVNVLVKVTDAGGKTLPMLKKDDFVIYEDNVQQDISYFEPVTAPLHLVLLLDLSGSTEKKMKVLKKAAQKFVDSLKPTDTIAVAGFTRRFFVISNFTTDHRLLKDRIDDIKNRHSGTAYYDAMWATLDLLEEARATRKAIVVLTDGVDNSLDHPNDEDLAAKHSFSELLERVEEADATIYPIYLDTEYETIGRGGRSGHDAYVTARKQLEALADQTGAVMFKAERAEDLEGVYQQVAAELHSLYSLAYAPKSLTRDGAWKKIGVSVKL